MGRFIWYLPSNSLKARLAEKKALVSGQGREHEEQENNKKNRREI